MGFLTKVGRILSGVFQKILSTTVSTVGFFDELLGKLVFRQVVVDEESVPVGADEMIEAAGVEDEVQVPRLPPVRESLAMLIKRACSMREAGEREWPQVFRFDDERHRKAAAWVASLSETNLISVKHMPTGRLDEHLLTDCSVGLSLPTWTRFDRHAYDRKQDAERAERAAQERRRREKLDRMLGVRPRESIFDES